MLERLVIENLAVIEKTEALFTQGFNVLTGETGAGKSILVGGLNAVTGGKMSRDLVRSGAEKAEVTAIFLLADNGDSADTVRAKMTEYGLTDDDGTLIVAREVAVTGKSTARINGKLVTASVLKDIVGTLADIHGQKDNRLIADADEQRKLLDGYGDLGAELSEYAEIFKEYSRLAGKLRDTRRNAEMRDEKIAFLSEKIKDVKRYKITTGDEDINSAKLKKLRNAENIVSALVGAERAISGGERQPGAADLLRQAREQLNNVAAYIEAVGELSERVKSAVIETDDIAREISALLSETGDISELPNVESRAADYAKLRRKYGVGGDELCVKLAEWEDELSSLKNADDEINTLENKKTSLAAKLKNRAVEITNKRAVAAEKLSRLLESRLNELNIPDARIKFAITPDKITVNGADGIEILISVNKGEDFKPLSRTASGGELSRVMLAIKAADTADGGVTSVFDEVDTGISGITALKVGEKLKAVSESRQVICITHLAQIASKADNHILIAKTADGERTFTTTTVLDTDGRKRELARIISGDPESETALISAAELLNK
ncbi:MAG: DNA repair protein RecN [Oscillospiraceae bacterium]|jgi:DNA repair protein RecN (Recombination protein N)|nr:DNA repair protein RecN [Oscillospiraceae bacterium]